MKIGSSIAENAATMLPNDKSLDTHCGPQTTDDSTPSGIVPKVSLVGLGKHGLRLATTLLAKPNDWNLVGVADASVASYAMFQSLHHRRRVPFFRTITEAIEAGVPDVIVVSTTAPSHVSTAIEIIDAGYAGHILLEKPISTSIGEGKRLLKYIGERGWSGAVAVNFSRRCSAFFSQAYEIIQSGELGRLVFAEYRRPVQISMNGSHFFDLMNWFSGVNVSQVSAQLDCLPLVDHRGSQFFDPVGRVRVTYVNGVTFLLDANGGSAGPSDGLRIMCEQGEIVLNAAETAGVLKGPSGERQLPSDKIGGGLNWFENSLSAFVKGRKSFPPATVEEALQSLEVVVAAHLSHRRGGDAIDFPLESQIDSELLRVA